MLAAVIFGIATALFVVSVILVFRISSLPDEPLGSLTSINFGAWLIVAAASSGLMYAIASGRLF